jgi:hypothetical protein
VGGPEFKRQCCQKKRQKKKSKAFPINGFTKQTAYLNVNTNYLMLILIALYIFLSKSGTI